MNMEIKEVKAHAKPLFILQHTQPKPKEQRQIWKRAPPRPSLARAIQQVLLHGNARGPVMIITRFLNPRELLKSWNVVCRTTNGYVKALTKADWSALLWAIQIPNLAASRKTNTAAYNMLMATLDALDKHANITVLKQAAMGISAFVQESPADRIQAWSFLLSKEPIVSLLTGQSTAFSFDTRPVFVTLNADVKKLAAAWSFSLTDGRRPLCIPVAYEIKEGEDMHILYRSTEGIERMHVKKSGDHVHLDNYTWPHADQIWFSPGFVDSFARGRIAFFFVEQKAGHIIVRRVDFTTKTFAVVATVSVLAAEDTAQCFLYTDEQKSGVECKSCGKDETRCPLVSCAGKPWCQSEPVRACFLPLNAGKFCGPCTDAIKSRWSVCRACNQKLDAKNECTNVSCDWKD